MNHFPLIKSGGAAIAVTEIAEAAITVEIAAAS